MDTMVTMKENERRLVLRNLAGGFSEIRGKSADNPVSLLGEGLDWLIVDEAARLKPAIWEGHLSQRLIDKKGWALLISTPSLRALRTDRLAEEAIPSQISSEDRSRSMACHRARPVASSRPSASGTSVCRQRRCRR